MEPAPSTQKLSRLSRRAHLLFDFLAVARTGGIRQAAGQVHASQSALTRRIQELEGTLNVSLFERTARGMGLTPFGQALLHHAEMVEMNCGYAALEIEQLLSGASGELRIAAGPAWAYEIAPNAIAATKKRLPGVKISLLARMNEATLPMLYAGRLDIVLGGFPDSQERSVDIVYEPLLTVEHLVFASDRHPLHSKRKPTARHLTDFPWIWFNEAVTGRHLLDAWFKRAGMPAPATSIDTTSVHFGFQVMQDERHLMLLPSTLATVAARHRLRPLNLRPSVGKYPAGLMYRPSVRRLRAFAEFRSTLLEGLL